jgi:hypothetical protein
MARRTLSNEVKQGILDGLKNGVSPVTLAGQFGVSIPTIYNYRKSQLVTATNAPVVAIPSVGLETAVVTANRTARKNAKVSR